MKRRMLVAGCAAMMLTGCNAAHQQAAPVPVVAPAQTFTEPEEVAANPGSLFNEAESEHMFADSRARRVGDIVLVKIVETSKGKNKADTTSERDTTNSFSVDAMGVPVGLDMLNPARLAGAAAAGTTNTTTPLLKTGSKSTLSGKGETKRENNVTATIAVRVIRAMPGGLLQVEGARETRVNEETQYIVLSGLIRARDVAADNSILSTQMADSKVAYYGKGVLADKQKPGWFSRLMDNVWPF